MKSQINFKTHKFLGDCFVAALLAMTVSFPATATEAASAPASAQPGDTLKITVYREPDLSSSFVVTDAGTITFPLIGTIEVQGKVPDEIEAEVALGLKKYILEPQVSVVHEQKKITEGPSGSTSSLHAVTVMGEVRNPGSYEVGESLTLTKAIVRAGGLTPTADDAKIKVIRQEEGREQQTVLIFSLQTINNAETEDPLILSGDKIVVPPQQKDTNAAAILGEVKSAGMYEVTPEFTLMKLIAKAGGFTPVASTNKVRVVRQEGGEKKIYLYNAGAIIGGQDDDPEIKAGDMVFIPETFF